MKFGLNENEYLFLDENLIEPLKKQGAEVYIFGSRATGRQQRFSDIDILYKGSVPSASVQKILAFFEDSSFPYKIDLVDDRELAASYRESVERDKKRV